MPVDIDGLTYEELLALHDQVLERLKVLEAMKDQASMLAFRLGARVSFDSRHGRELGTIIKFNRKTVTILGDDGRQWRVSPGLLSPVKDVDSNPPRSDRAPQNKRLR